MSEKVLQGMKEITSYVGRDKRTVYRWIEQDGFPAIKVAGRWESNTALVDRWRMRRIEKAVCAES